MTTLSAAIARARAEAFPKPIVVIHMSQERFDLAMSQGNVLEQKWLSDGLASGQIEIGPIQERRSATKDVNA